MCHLILQKKFKNVAEFYFHAFQVPKKVLPQKIEKQDRSYNELHFTKHTLRVQMAGN